MIYRGYEIRAAATGFEATEIEEGWNCDWNWIVTGASIESVKKIIDENLKWGE